MLTHNITIRKSVRQDIVELIPTLISKSLEWMGRKYPNVNFNNVEFIFSSGYNRSRYFRNENNDKHKTPTVCISTRARLILYDKKSLGIKNNDVFVGSEIQMMCALIHELTHHVQYENNHRKGNELDTTSNELEYLKENHIKHYNKIVS